VIHNSGSLLRSGFPGRWEMGANVCAKPCTFEKKMIMGVFLSYYTH
jgi:hypothetical protein